MYWKAKWYSRYDNITMGDLQRRAGGRKWKNAYPPTTEPNEITKAGELIIRLFVFPHQVTPFTAKKFTLL